MFFAVELIARLGQEKKGIVKGNNSTEGKIEIVSHLACTFMLGRRVFFAAKSLEVQPINFAFGKKLVFGLMVICTQGQPQ